MKRFLPRKLWKPTSIQNFHKYNKFYSIHFCRKRVLQHASGKGGGKIENYTNAFLVVCSKTNFYRNIYLNLYVLQIIKYIRKNAESKGNSEVVQKCDNLLVGDVIQKIKLCLSEFVKGFFEMLWYGMIDRLKDDWFCNYIDVKSITQFVGPS